MATPVGHALVGVTVGLAATGRRPLTTPWGDVALFAAMGVAADLDFVPGFLFGAWDSLHHGPTHSVGAALIVAALAALAGRLLGGRAWRWGLALGLVYLSHVVVDALTMDFSPPPGVPLWWPLSGEFVMADHPVFMAVRREAFTWEVISHDLRALALELALLGPPCAFVMWRRGLLKGPRRAGSEA